jgi:hypothetical protein
MKINNDKTKITAFRGMELITCKCALMTVYWNKWILLIIWDTIYCGVSAESQNCEASRGSRG